MLYDNLKDIIHHTKPFFDAVKIINDEAVTKVQAISPGHTIILHGALNKPIPEIVSCIGLSRMNILEGMLRFPPFTANTSKVEFQSQEKNGVKELSEVKFESPEGHTAFYRFMNSKEADRRIQVPPFSGAEWDVQVDITKKNLNDLSHLAGVLSGAESKMQVSSKAGKLSFKIGGAGSDRTVIPISNEVSKSLVNDHTWNISEVLSILKLGDTGRCVLSISDMGIMKVEINSGLGIYSYYLVSMTCKT